MEQRQLDVKGYEKVVEFIDKPSGLHAIIAIHDSRLGVSLGGTRAYPYASVDEALTDVLRLSMGMTYKSAITEAGTGGAKAVIITDYRKPKSKELLHAYADAVNSFEGAFICAEDLGMTQADLDVIAERTRYIVGFADTSGNPSRYTAWGTYLGIQAVCQHLWKSPSVAGKTFAIQGLGSVGSLLADRLFWEGARLIVADVDEERTKQAKRDFGASVVSTDEIASVECDVFVPCALGGILSEQSIPKLRCRAVAGSTNNQLLTLEDGERLYARDILYAPDYLINAGGLLNVCQEILPEGYDPIKARMAVSRIYDQLLSIFKMAEEKGEPSYKIAEEISEYNLETGIGKRTEPVTFHR